MEPGKPSQRPALNLPETKVDAEPDKDNAKHRHRKVSKSKSDTFTVNSSVISDDSNASTPTDLSERSLGDLPVSDLNRQTSDYFTATDQSSGEEPGSEYEISSDERSGGNSDSFSSAYEADTSDPETNIVISSAIESGHDTLVYESTEDEEEDDPLPVFLSSTDVEDSDVVVFIDSGDELTEEKKKPRRKRQRFFHPHSAPAQPVVITLPEPIGNIPEQQGLKFETITRKFDEGFGLNAKRFTSQDGERWVLRTRHMPLKNSLDVQGALHSDTVEAELLKDLRHPNIIAFKGFTATKEKDGYYTRLAMEDGGVRLDDFVATLAKVTGARELVKYAAQLMDGLDYLRKQKILHRDIKPGNLLVNDKTGILKISDFGSAHDRTYYMATDYPGTRHFAAPEARRMDSYDYEADMYSAGVVMLDALMHLGVVCQSTIRDLGEDGQMVLKIKDGVRLNEYGQGFIDLVQEMIDIDPEGRPSASNMANQFKQLLLDWKKD